MSATPRPWIVDDFGEPRGTRTRIGTSDGSQTYYHRSTTIACCLTNHRDAYCDVPIIGVLQAEANAKLIVRAVNLHDELLAALKAMDAYFADDNPGGAAADGWLAKLHADAQAAILKAEAREP